MELYQLRTFVAVAEEKNVTKAAKRLFTTPPSVSNHIKALESELNVQLFVRTANGMEITEKGLVLRDKAEQALFAAQDMVNHATNLSDELMGKISIAVCASFESLQIPKLIQQMKHNLPGIDLELGASHSRKVMQDLNQNLLDGGFIFDRPIDDKIVGHALTSVELVVATPYSWKAQMKNADWDDLAKLPWITSNAYCPFQTLVKSNFDQHKLSYNESICSDDEATKADLVCSGVGVTLLEKDVSETLEKQEKIYIWKNESFRCDLYFAYLEKRAKDPIIAAFKKELSKLWNTPI